MNYYIVTAKCGHVGRYNFIRIDFPVMANSKQEASDEVSKYPRVKKDHKDKILGLREATFDEFIAQQEINRNDPYLKCVNIQEQNNIEGFEDRIERDVIRDEKDHFKPNNKSASRKYRYLRDLDAYSYYEEDYLDEDYDFDEEYYN